MGVRDPDQTQRRILAAAAEEFAARGISGARVDAIAERAGVNKRMLYYYFGSKEQLFREVLRRRLVDKLTESPPTFTTADGRAGRSDYYLDESEYVRLLMWEALEMPVDVEGQAERADLFARWRVHVEEAQAAGDLPDHLDPAQLVLSEVALTLFPAAFPQITRMITGMAPTSGEFRSARAAFLEALGELGAGTVPQP